MLLFTTMVSIASVIFVGGSSTQGPRGTYSVPEAGGIRWATLARIPLSVLTP